MGRRSQGRPGERLSIAPGLQDVLSRLDDFFRSRDVEAYVVGGFLRDALLGRDSRDIDVSIAADPLVLGRELADELGGHFFPLSEEDRVVRVLTSDGGVQVDLMALRGEIEADLWERDYTIDALAATLGEAASGSVAVIDPTGGRDDLRRRVVRVVREQAFRDDGLRPLRGVRLAVELDFRIEPETAALVRVHAPYVAGVAAERQRDELMRIMATPRAGQGVRLLDDLGLLDVVIPEIAETRGVEQPKEHYRDVFGHLLDTVAYLDVLLAEEEPPARPARDLWRELWGRLDWWEDGRDYFREESAFGGRPRSAVVKLCGLLHDIAKPETKTFDGTGRMRFFGHADVGAKKAGRILRRLRFSRREVEMVTGMVKAHLRPVQMAQEGPPTRRAIYRYFRDCGEAAVPTLFLSLADHLATVGPGLNMDGWRQHVALINYILAERFKEEGAISPPKLITGNDLMTELKISPGPLVGRLLEMVREAQAAGEVSTREEALDLARAHLSDQASSGSSSEGDRPWS